MRVSFRKVWGVLFVFTIGAAVFLFSSDHSIKAATGTIWYAKPAATGAGDCTTWADACTLQDALTAGTLAAGDEIWVMQGTHVPTTNPLDRAATFALVSGVGVYGGFNGTETDLSQRAPDTYVTILSGDIDGDDNQNPVTDLFTSSGTSTNSYIVVTCNNVTDAVLDGLTITGGFADDTGAHEDGAGINIQSSSLTLNDLDITGNYADGGGGGIITSANTSLALTDVTIRNNVAFFGGGMLSDTDAPVLTNVTFSDNFGWTSGGMYNYSSDAVLTSVTFENNETWDAGGGMYNENSNPRLTDVEFIENSADNLGGGMYNYESSPTLTDVSFDKNEATYDGGGMANDYYSSPTLTNVMFTNNHADWGGGMDNYEYSSPILTNVIFKDNVADVDGGGMENDHYSSPTLTNVTFTGNHADSWGGGMDNWDESNPILTDVTFENNTAGTDGGGMYNGDLSVPELTNVTFKNNTADDDGGGIANEEAGDPILNNVIFDSNHADDDGGGMYSYNVSNPTLTNVTFKNNSAGDSGGGMYNITSSDPVLNNVTFSNNTAVDSGGAVRNYTDSYPSFTNVTITGNQALYGGGIANGDYSYATLNNVTISGNTAAGEGGGIINSENGYSVVSNSIVSGNTAPTGANYYDDGTNGTSTVADSVIEGGYTGTNIITTDPLLDNLADNGGFTQTMALKDGSPAIDAGGVNQACAAVDQRGVTRPQGAGCDIGAYEGGDAFLKVSSSDPENKTYLLNLSTLSVTFSDPPLADGSPDAADFLGNYLLVNKGENKTFDTTSCAGGVQTDDLELAFSGVSYDSSTMTATLTLASPLASPVNDGHYRLFVCGTTSIWGVGGLELNNGTGDTVINFFIGEQAADELPETGFAQGLVTNLPAQPTEKAYTDSGLLLRIPGLDVEMEIVGVPLVDDEWDTSWLGASAGWLEGSAFPTWEGNTVLTGHVWDANNAPGPFADLKDLAHGDRIEVVVAGYTYVYEVRESSLVFPGKVDKVFQHEDHDYITLLTCEMYNPLTGNYLMRRMVRAVLVDVQ